MKKITILVLALTALSFASCKKDRICNCYDSTGSEVRTLKKVTKSQAQAECQTVTHTEAGSTSTETCSLK